MRRIALATIALVALSGCDKLTPAEQKVITIAVDLGQIAYLNNTTAQKIVDNGILLCNVAGTLKAVAGINVTGTLAADMDKVCAALGGIGAALPKGASASKIPVVAAPAVAIKPAV